MRKVLRNSAEICKIWLVPDPPILVFFFFFDFLAFLSQSSLLFCAFFFLFQGFGGFRAGKNPCFLGVSLVFIPKKQGLEGQGWRQERLQRTPRKFAENLWKLFCSDPFPNDPRSELLTKRRKMSRKGNWHLAWDLGEPLSGFSKHAMSRPFSSLRATLACCSSQDRVGQSARGVFGAVQGDHH